MKQYKTLKKQSGFTIIELVIVMAIIGLFLLVTQSGLFESQDDAKLQSAEMVLVKDFPSAITRIMTMTRKCTSASMSREKLIARGAPQESVYGGEWTVSVGANVVTITYPIDIDDADFATGVKEKLIESRNVKSATASTSALVVGYRCT